MTENEFRIELSKIYLHIAQRELSMLKFIGCLFIAMVFFVLLVLWFP